jgi:hypothetical protein
MTLFSAGLLSRATDWVLDCYGCGTITQYVPELPTERLAPVSPPASAGTTIDSKRVEANAAHGEREANEIWNIIIKTISRARGRRVPRAENEEADCGKKGLE